MFHRDAVTTVGSQVGIQIIGLVTGIVVARWLGPIGRGELAAIIAWVSMLTYFGNMGLPVAYTYAAAREPSRAYQLLGNELIAVLIQWPTLIIIGLVVLWLAFHGHNQHLIGLAAIYLCLYVPLNLVTIYTNSIQQGLGRYNGFNAVRLCVPISYLAGIAALAVLGHRTVAGVLSANIFGNFITLVLALSLVIPLAQKVGSTNRVFSLSALLQDARYGISAHLGSIQPFNALRVDVLILSLLVTNHDLGLYMIALAGAGLIRAQGTALGMVVMPEVAKHNSREEQRKIIKQFGVYAVLLGAFMAAVVFIWAMPLIKFIYGDAFAGAASTLRLLVLVAICASLYRILSDGLRGMGQPLAATIAELLSLLVGAPAIYVLGSIRGIDGAAIGVGLASFASLFAALVAIFRPVSHTLKGEIRA